MTIQDSRTQEFTVDEICTFSLQLAGLTAAGQNPQTNEIGQARIFLQMALKDLQNYGAFARNVNFIDVPMVIDTYRYDVPESTINIIGDAMYIRPGQPLTKAAGETIVQRQSRDNWQRNSAKDARGQPTLYFVNREESPIEVWVWPIPDEAGTIRFQEHRMVADVSDGSSTLDFHQYWDKHIAYNVAEMLAEAAGFNADKISRLAKRSKEFRNMARQTANQGVPIQMSVAYNSHSRRRR